MKGRSFAVAVLAGLLFGVGLVISGMTMPAKIIGFLDVFGAWDASLLFVMGAAVPVYFVADRLRRARPRPLFASIYLLPSRTDIDARLLIGAAIFGVGWGMSGLCPGPAIVSTVGGAWQILVFVGCMLAGLFAADTVLDR